MRVAAFRAHDHRVPEMNSLGNCTEALYAHLCPLRRKSPGIHDVPETWTKDSTTLPNENHGFAFLAKSTENPRKLTPKRDQGNSII